MRVNAELDGVNITSGRPLTPASEAEPFGPMPSRLGSAEAATSSRAAPPPLAATFFSGAVSPGHHVIGAAFVTLGASPDVAYSRDVAFAVSAGDHLRIVFTVTGRTATAATT